MNETIDRFRGEHEYLSNFYRGEFQWMGHVWQTAEHAFQASKATTVTDYQSVRTQPGPREAKRAGRAIRCRPDWDSVKKTIMLEILMAKFRQVPGLQAQLVATGDARLVEGNDWGDDFWGALQRHRIALRPSDVVWAPSGLNGSDWWAGQNWLGRELMMVREVLS